MKENVLEKSHFVPTSSPSIPVEVIVWKHANITLSLFIPTSGAPNGFLLHSMQQQCKNSISI